VVQRLGFSHLHHMIQLQRMSFMSNSKKNPMKKRLRTVGELHLNSDGLLSRVGQFFFQEKEINRKNVIIEVPHFNRHDTLYIIIILIVKTNE
jgi:uncharacterized Rmd1/YagE family protein